MTLRNPTATASAHSRPRQRGRGQLYEVVEVPYFPTPDDRKVPYFPTPDDRKWASEVAKGLAQC